MTTLTATVAPRTITRKLCTACQLPATDVQGLVYENGGYIHPLCSTREYEFVTEVSFPDDEPEPDPTTPASAAAGVVLCDDCEGLCRPFLPGELCDGCQEAVNEWESDHAPEPDYDRLYERVEAAKDYLLLAA